MEDVRNVANKDIKLVNLTIHDIDEVTTGTKIPPSGIIARVKTSNEKIGTINGKPVYRTTFHELEGLPEPKDGVIYIVSALALNAVPADRTDVIAPGNPQRDEKGTIIGCMGFRV